MWMKQLEGPPPEIYTAFQEKIQRYARVVSVVVEKTFKLWNVFLKTTITDDLPAKFCQIGVGCRIAFLRRPIGQVAGSCLQ